MGTALQGMTAQTMFQEHKDALAVARRGGPAALELWRAAAMALPKAEIQRFNGHAPLVSFNAIRGVESLRPQAAQCAALPGFDPAMFDMAVSLSKALDWAAHEAQSYAKPAIAAGLMKRAHAARTLMLQALLAAARAEIIPLESLKSIKSATGGLKLALACVDCALLMKTHAPALDGKTPITEKDIEEAEQVGIQLLDILRPKMSHWVRPTAHIEKIELRDRLWTLLFRLHGYLRRAGAFVFGNAVDEMVPILFAGRRPRSRPRVLDENGEPVKSKAQLAREKRAAERKAKADAKAKAEEKRKAEANEVLDNA
jgi:hypothetical protein